MEVCEIEKNFLQELQMQLNSMRKSSIRSKQSTHDMKSTSKDPASDKPASSRSTYQSVTNTKIDYSTSSSQSTEMNSKSDKPNLGKSTYQLVTEEQFFQTCHFCDRSGHEFSKCIFQYPYIPGWVWRPKRITNDLVSNLECSKLHLSQNVWHFLQEEQDQLEELLKWQCCIH